MKVYELQAAIKKTAVAPLYLIVGEEDELRDQAVALIKSAVFGQQSGLEEFNLDMLYGDECDAAEIVSRAGEAPAFAPRRLVLVKAADKLPLRDGEALLPYLKNPCDTTTLVFVAPKVDGRAKFALSLKERAVVVDCSPLPDHHVMNWIRAEAGRLGIRLNEQAVLLLRDMVGSGSLSLVRRELEKLAAYVEASPNSSRMVSPAEVEALRGSEVGASVFDLTAAVGARNHERVLRILARNLESGEAPLRILGSLVWQYRQLWKAKDLLNQSRGDYEAGRMLRMPPFKVREFLGLFSETHLSAAFRMFLETDSKLKGGTANAPGRVLESLLLDLCGREKEAKPNPKGNAGVPRSPQSPIRRVAPSRDARTVRSERP
ncbi:MAG: DNA polymerase III subunit delta [Nitrospiraceae bacterium]|nr:DNA polymerase III subunit delta [Nitrospiraceae bacterium]